MCLDLQSQISIIHLLVGATKCGDLTRHSKREENHLVRQWDRFMKWTKMNLPLSASIALSLISVIPSIQSKDVGCCLYRPKLKMVVPKNHSYGDSTTQATWSVSRTRWGKWVSTCLALVLLPESPLPFETNTFPNRYCPRFLRLEIFSKRAKVNQTWNCPKCWPSRNMFWYVDSRINDLLLAILILNKPSTLNQVNLYHAEQISSWPEAWGFWP